MAFRAVSTAQALSSLPTLILSVFSLIVLGYLAKVLKLLESKDTGLLNKIIVYILLPALIFQAVKTANFSARLAVMPLMAIIIGLVTLAAAYIVGRVLRLKKTVFGGFLLAAAVGNTGYLGYPLTQQIFGQSELVKAIFYDIFGTVVFIFTVGLFIAESYGSGGAKINKIKEIITFPPLIALAASYLLKPVALPAFVTSAVSFLAAATIPLIMISIGLSLQLGKLKDYLLPLIAVLLLKLIVGPLVAIGLGKTLALDAHTFRVLVLEASMPSAMLTLILGLKYRLNTDYLSAAILITTAVSLVTIPLWQQIASLAFGGR